MNRREFVGTTTAAAAAAMGLDRPASATHLQSTAYLFRGAVVYDGTGSPPMEVEVLVVGDRIAEVARRVSRSGAEVVDLGGHALAPGFIDIHTHTDLNLFVSPLAESKIRQGVTTEVTGQDGDSIGPWTAERTQRFRERSKSRYGFELTIRDIADFLREIERHGTAVNLATMVGQGTVREHVVGVQDRPATPEEIEQMRRLVADALEQGACGMSSGLEYVPGAFTPLEELVAVARPLSALRLPYATHMRNEDDRVLAAIEEAINVGRLADVPVQISHLKAQNQRNWWKARVMLTTLEAAREDGIDVTYDRYPYVAFSTGLTNLFPVWSRDGGTAGLLERLEQPETASAIEAGVRAKVNALGSWDAVQVTSTADSTYAWAVGRKLGELARERGEEPYALLLALITGNRGSCGMVGFGMSEENTERILSHPLGMVCSDGSALAVDGPLAAGTPHPRSFGTFPRVLGYYCRDRGAMPLETAIHKMTGMPAARLRFAERGLIRPGAFADLVAFDPDAVADRATFANPHQYPVGIPHVMVNGTFALRDGEHTGALAGRIVKPDPA
ncbi:MAG: D-aminoacylase [Gemmatimonadales bacterium]|jgi:N-acyl-D-amino-acid deacylase